SSICSMSPFHSGHPATSAQSRQICSGAALVSTLCSLAHIVLSCELAESVAFACRYRLLVRNRCGNRFAQARKHAEVRSCRVICPPTVPGRDLAMGLRRPTRSGIRARASNYLPSGGVVVRDALLEGRRRPGPLSPRSSVGPGVVRRILFLAEQVAVSRRRTLARTCAGRRRDAPASCGAAPALAEAETWTCAFSEARMESRQETLRRSTKSWSRLGANGRVTGCMRTELAEQEHLVASADNEKRSVKISDAQSHSPDDDDT